MRNKIEILNFISGRPPKVALFLLGFLLIFAQFGQMRKVSLDGCSFPHSLFFFFFSYNSNQTRECHVNTISILFSPLPFFSNNTVMFFNLFLFSSLLLSFSSNSKHYIHTHIHIYIYIYILKSSINVDFNIELHINYLKHTKTFNSNNLLI